tara:strand:+ start:959 stop:1132 length:174 start_codon:yes stop_codon:yes gene_type:complete
MADIKTTTQEFAMSGSLSSVQKIVEDTDNVYEGHATIKYLARKVDELISEVNILKNQ